MGLLSTSHKGTIHSLHSHFHSPFLLSLSLLTSFQNNFLFSKNFSINFLQNSSSTFLLLSFTKSLTFPDSPHLSSDLFLSLISSDRGLFFLQHSFIMSLLTF